MLIQTLSPKVQQLGLQARSYLISLKYQMIRAATMNTHEYEILLHKLLLCFILLFAAFPLVQLF